MRGLAVDGPVFPGDIRRAGTDLGKGFRPVMIAAVSGKRETEEEGIGNVIGSPAAAVQ